MYKPDESFMRKLKELDPKLGCIWNRDIERFVIIYDRPYKGHVSLFIIKDGDGLGTFRQPDQRDIDHLNRYDLSKTRMKDYLDEISKYIETYREDRKKAFKDEIRNRTKDDKVQLMRSLARLHSPKAFGGTYRKINLKKNKNTFTVTDRRRISQDEIKGAGYDSNIQSHK